MTANRHFMIAAGRTRRPDHGDHDELERMAGLFERLGYEPAGGRSAGMSARELATAVPAFVTAAERTADDVLVVCHAGGEITPDDLARWLVADSKIGTVLLVLAGAGPVDTDAVRTRCGTTTVVVATTPGPLSEAFVRAVTELDRTGGDRPDVAVADVVHRLGGHLHVIGGVGPGPLSPAELAALSRIVAGLGDPGERAVAALYRQSVERATGLPAPEPLGGLRTYTDLIRELSEYLPGSTTGHPLVQCCALLTAWFPDTPGMPALTSLAGKHLGDTTGPARAVEQVGHFRRHASAEAFELVRHLAVVPLSIPVMRQVHHTTCADPHPAHLAEVYRGGLLCPVASTDPDAVSFDFAPGVREVLLGLLRRTEATRVLNAVSHLRATPDPLDHAALAVANRPPTGDAWDVTIRRTADPLYRYLCRLLDAPEDAEDAVQEVFAAAMARGAPPDDDTVLFGLADTVARKRLAG